jgi:chemotaxis protein methyltransferase CheR
LAGHRASGGRHVTSALGRADVERFRSVVCRRFGWFYEDAKLEFLEDILRQRLEATGVSRADIYIDRVSSLSAATDELRVLAEQLTVNETFFFRNIDNFHAFTRRVLPERTRAKRRLRILSAGCASGEEPYTLAIAAREALPDIASWDVKIVGVDVSPAMIAKAERGHYSAWSLRATPEDVKKRYFRTEGRDFVLAPEVRSMVTFEERNFIEDDLLIWPPETYDVIFCRNVIMYFTPEVMRHIVRRVSQALLPGGFFFLGHAETLRGLSQEFHLCHTHESFYYQKREGAAATSVVLDAPVAIVDELPQVVDTSGSWVDAIHQASERIAQLARQPVAQAPAALSVAPPMTRSWDLGLVLEAMRQERFVEALALLSALPSESHNDPDALLLRAVLLTNSGQLVAAEAACASVLAADELNAGAHYVMALCREHARDLSGAREHDQTAVYLDAGFAMPHLHMGLAAKRAGDDATARHELSQAVTLLAREDAARLMLFGGGFSREALLALCRNELRAVGGDL